MKWKKKIRNWLMKMMTLMIVVETDGQYVAEVTYTTDGEISQEEASAELQEAYNECDDLEDMQQLKENANENEHIEVHNAEVVERPEK